MRKFQPGEDEFLRTNCLTIPAKRMAKMLGRSESAARQRMARLRIEVPAEVVERFKKDSRFKPGSEPKNKGKKQIHYMTRDAIERTAATRFRKGNIPPNTYRENGVITIRTDKRTGRQYQYIRLEKGKWKELHRFNYQKHFGAIPKGMCVAFNDGNTLNADVSNLELISRAENMKRNTVHNYPKDIAVTIQLRGALNRQINKHRKKLSA